MKRFRSDMRYIILLACGSFNPPTNMHLRMFELARDKLQKGGDYIVPVGLVSPTHDKYNKEGLASANERKEMVKLALDSSSWIYLSDWEMTREDWTPTREVLQYHQDVIDAFINGNIDPIMKRPKLESDNPWLGSLAQVPSASVKLLCGADLLESFSKPGLWKDEDIEAIVEKFGLVVVTREGSNPYKFIYESDLLTKFQRNIHIVPEWIPNEVSSTRIRRALRRGESIKYLTMDSVINYIYKHCLYNSHENLAPEASTLKPQGFGAALIRQHAQSSTPSDLERDTPQQLSPCDGVTVSSTCIQMIPSKQKMTSTSVEVSDHHGGIAPKIIPAAPDAFMHEPNNLDARQLSSIDSTALSTMLNRCNFISSSSIKSPSSAKPVHNSKKALSAHPKSKSSSCLKVERKVDKNDDVFVDNIYSHSPTFHLDGGSYMNNLIPSHTEVCLSHVPGKKVEKPVLRGRSGERLYASRSLERPSTPRRRYLSPSRRVVSLPISRGRSRDHSPSPDSLDFETSIDELRSTARTPKPTRTLTHEQEIKMIIKGDQKFIRPNVSDTKYVINYVPTVTKISSNKGYEMRF